MPGKLITETGIIPGRKRRRKPYSKPSILWRGELPEAGILYLNNGGIAWEIASVLRSPEGGGEGELVRFIKVLHKVP